MSRRHVSPLEARRRHVKRRQLIERDGLVCWLCGDTISLDAPLNHADAISIDHVVPRGLGGRHELSNLKLAHRACNTRRDLEPIKEVA